MPCGSFSKQSLYQPEGDPQNACSITTCSFTPQNTITPSVGDPEKAPEFLDSGFVGKSTRFCVAEVKAACFSPRQISAVCAPGTKDH